MELGAAPPLVGRVRELAAFRAALSAARNGTGTSLLVRAPAGGGKTTLAGKVAEIAAGAGAIVLSATCWDGPFRPALWPWLQLLRTLDAEAPDAVTAAPALAELLAGRDLAEQDLSPADQLVVFDGVVEALTVAATTRPVVVLVDDVHWSDRTSLELLRFVSSRLIRCGVVVWVGYRPDDLDKEVASSLSELERGGTVLDLDALAVDELRTLLGPGLSDDQVSWIHETGGGNPFFSLELGAMVRAGTGKRGRLRNLPRSITGVVEHQLDGLAVDERRRIEAASVQGKEFEPAVVAAVTGVPAVELDATCAAAAGRGLLAGPPWRFVHALTADAVHDRIDPAVRAQLHLATAEALGQLGDPDVAAESMLGHLVAGGAPGPVIADVARRAASRARGRAAWTEQVEYLALAADNASAEQLLPVLVELAAAYVAIGDHDLAHATCDRAADIARRRDDHRALARIALVAPPPLGSIELSDWHDPRQTALRREALAGLPEEDDPLRARLMSALAVSLYWADGSGVRALDHEQTLAERDRLTAEGLAMARRLADDRAIADALNARLSSMWGPDGDQERPAIANELVEYGRRLGDRHHEFTGRMIRIMHLLRQARLAEAEAEIDQFDHDAAAAGLRLHRWTAARWRSLVAMLHGRVDESASLAADACRTGLPVVGETAKQFRSAAFGWHAYFRRHVREIGESAARLARESPHVPAWWVGAGWYGTEGGPEQYAREAMTRLGVDGFRYVPRDVNWITTLNNLASVAFWMQDTASARQIEEKLGPYRGQLAILGVGYAYYGPISRALALCAATGGDETAAAALFTEAIETSDAFGDPYGALARFEFAVAVERSPDRYPGWSASELFDAAVERFGALGLDEFVERVREVRRDGPVETVELREDGRRWTLRLRDEEWELPPLKGLRALRELLRQPGADVHVLDLVAAIEGGAVRERGVESLDRAAIAEYRRRMEEIGWELDEADRRGDAAASARLAEEQRAIEVELRRGLGLAGTTRTAGASAERARVMITKQLGRAVDRLGECDRTLGRHLRETVETGTYVTYRPGATPLHWDID